MNAPVTGLVSERAQREQEALRQLWQIVAWGGAVLAIFVRALFPGEAGQLIFYGVLGVIALACWQLREPVQSGITFRYNTVAFITLTLTMAFVIGMLVLYLFINPIVSVFTDWYVKKFP